MSQSRREARATYKREPDAWVVFVVRTGGRSWVGVSPNLAATKNRLGFALRLGNVPEPGLQAAWDGTLEVEALEALDPELSALRRRDVAEARKSHWCAVLEAAPMLR